MKEAIEGHIVPPVFNSCCLDGCFSLLANAQKSGKDTEGYGLLHSIHAIHIAFSRSESKL